MWRGARPSTLKSAGLVEVLVTAAGIALPSLLIAWLVHRWFGPLSWRVAGGFLLLVFAILARSIFTPEMPVVLAEVMRGDPYRGVVGPVISVNPDTNDTVKQMLPWMQVVREELFSLRAPLWNRYSFSGYPLLGNGQSAPFSPFFLLTLFVALPKQLVAMAGVKLFVGLLFTYLFAKREGVSHWAASFAAVVFALSVFQNIYLYYPLSSVTFLFPVLAFGVVTCLRQPSLRSVVLIGIATASSLLGGHPESVIHSAIGILMLLIIEGLSGGLSDRRGFLKGTVVACAGAIGGALAALPGWLPVFLQALDSQRMMLINSGGFQALSYPLNEIWILFNADGYGNPGRGTWGWILNYSMVAPTYLGLLPLALLIAATFAGNRRDRLFAAAAIVLFLMAMNWTPIGRLANALISFIANDRVRFVVVFFVAVVGARLLDRLGARLAVAAIVSSTAVGALALYVYGNQVGRPMSSGAVIAVAGLAAMWTAFRFRRPLAPLVACLVTAAELLYFNWPFNAMNPRRYFRLSLPIIERIHAEAPAEPYRIVGHDWVLLPNASAQYGLEDIRGSDPMAWRSYIEFFRLLQAPGQTLDVGRVQDIAHPAVAFLNVRYLLAEPEARFGPPYRLIYQGRDGTLFRHEAQLPRFFTPAALIRRGSGPLSGQLGAIRDFRESVVVEDLSGANTVLSGMWIRQMNPRRFRLTLDAPRRTFVASSQPALPGWRVIVNGRRAPIHRVNGAFIGFFVPAGKVRVVVDYRPPAFYLSLGMTLLVVGGFGVRRLAAAFSRRKTSERGGRADPGPG